MDRLTERDEYGNADIIGVDSEALQLNLEFDEFNRVTNALNRLAAYEDTGLEPEEVAELVQADKDGRCVVLPDCPNCAYQQNGNISLACSNCIGGQRLYDSLFLALAEAASKGADE